MLPRDLNPESTEPVLHANCHSLLNEILNLKNLVQFVNG
jgi:hypothetical protein